MCAIIHGMVLILLCLAAVGASIVAAEPDITMRWLLAAYC